MVSLILEHLLVREDYIDDVATMEDYHLSTMKVVALCPELTPTIVARNALLQQLCDLLDEKALGE